MMIAEVENRIKKKIQTFIIDTLQVSHIIVHNRPAYFLIYSYSNESFKSTYKNTLKYVYCMLWWSKLDIFLI